MTGKKVFYIGLFLFVAGSVALLFALGGRDGKETAASSGTVQEAQAAPAPAAVSGTVYDKNAYPPNGWTVSMARAAEEAKASGKMILLDFTGSDWCVWCQKLTKEVFSTPEFLSWADENLVMVFLDFPSSLVLDDKIVQQNQALQQALGVQGYPTILLLDSDLTPLLQTGYREGGAQAYIDHLTNDRLELDEEAAANFRQGFGGMITEYLAPLNI